jgi:hypothetical protein
LSILSPSAGGAFGATNAPAATASAASIPDSAARVSIERVARRAGLRTEILDQALVALEHAVDAGAVRRDSVLTVIDYSPATSAGSGCWT